MISTRVHGLIDYGVASLFAGLAFRSTLPRTTRACLGAAAAYHGSYATLTDYEAGLSPRLSMPQHLLLDALGAACLCGAGLLLRREPVAARAVLLAAGVAEFAVIGASSDAPRRGPGQGGGVLDRVLGDPEAAQRTGYAPLEIPKPFAPDVFVVDSVMPGVIGQVLPIRMTVLRLPDGALVLHSPTPYSLALLHRLRALGRIAHLVAPSFAHWMFVHEWQRACPEAKTWVAPGLPQRGQVRRSGLRIDAVLHDVAPPAWGEAIEIATVPGGFGFHEVALFHRPSATLVLTDLVLNLDRHKLPAWARPVIRAFGSMAGSAMPPPYLRAIVRMRHREAAQVAARLLALRPRRVILAHGRCFEQDGAARLRHAWRWLLD